MTIPIPAPNIGTTGVVPSDVERLLNRILQGSEVAQRQQQIDTEKERLKLEQKKLKDAEAQHQQEQAQLASLGEVARALLMGMEPQTELPAGSIPFGAAAQSPVTVQSPFAQLLQQLPAEQVTGVLPLLQQLQTMQGTQAKTAGQILENRTAMQRVADDQAIRRIVGTLETVPLNQKSIGRVITQVAAIDPAKAQQLAGSLSSLVPGYSAHVNPNGTVSWVSNQPGAGVVGAPLQPKPGDADQRKIGGFARRALDAAATMTHLEKKNPGIGQRVDVRLRAVKGFGDLPLGLGRTLETLFTPTAFALFSKDEQEYALARMDLAEAILRPSTGAAYTGEELARVSQPFVVMETTNPDVVRSIQQRRLALGLDYADQAGVEFRPDRLSPLARRFYVRALTGLPDEPEPQVIQSVPGTTVTPVAPPSGNWNPFSPAAPR